MSIIKILISKTSLLSSQFPLEEHPVTLYGYNHKKNVMCYQSSKAVQGEFFLSYFTHCFLQIPFSYHVGHHFIISAESCLFIFGNKVLQSHLERLWGNESVGIHIISQSVTTSPFDFCL